VGLGVTLNAVFDGPPTASPLVLGPSLGTTTDMWQPQTPTLAEHFRVVRFDLPGHGGSPAQPVPRTIADLGTRVLSTLDAASIGRASYVGLSLGGMVGMWLAAHAPERIDRLVLLCTSARLGPPEYWHARAEAVSAKGMDAIADSVPVRWFTPTFRSGYPVVYERYRDMLRSSKPDGYAACCAVIAAMDLRADLGRIEADTLVIAGADDEAIPVTHAALIAEAIPGARLEVVADAAHLANVEQPARITGLLLDHLLNLRAEEMA
jgi:3-oxoadipate enol-lactonase